MSAPDFWSNRERAQAEVEEVSRLRSLINPFLELEREIEDFNALQQLAGEETDEQNDAGGDEGIEEGLPEAVEVMEVNWADLRHAVGEKGIADRGCEHDGQQDEVTLRGEGVLHLLPV